MTPPRFLYPDTTLQHLMLHRNNKRRAQAFPRPGVPLTKVRFCAKITFRRRYRRWEEIVVGIDSIIIMLIVGAIAGWLAGNIVRGFGYGLIWNIIIGIVGAFIGVWLLTRLGFVPFAGFVGSIVNAVIGAVVLLLIVGFIRR
jgi:uncharacterized membrane protein YeaQ/YmgE (transglycosylase-associated protein family)